MLNKLFDSKTFFETYLILFFLRKIHETTLYHFVLITNRLNLKYLLMAFVHHLHTLAHDDVFKLGLALISSPWAIL